MINYKWIGAKPEKNHYQIWAIVEMHRNGYDGLNGSANYTYINVDGRNDQRMRVKHFQENERNMMELINRKALKGYEVISTVRFNELCPDMETQISALINELMKSKK